MYSVLIFADSSVGIVHASWFIQNDLVLWPKCTSKVLYDNLLKGTLPRGSMKACSYTVYRSCESFGDALSAQDEALENGHLSSTEGGKTREPTLGKRKRVPKRLPDDFTAESDDEFIDDGTSYATAVFTPPPPKLLCASPPRPSCSHDKSHLANLTSRPTENTMALCEPSTSATMPAMTSINPFLSTSSPRKETHVISPDFATLILQNMEKIHSLVLRLLLRLDDGCVRTPTEGSTRPCLPLTSKEAFDQYDDSLQDHDRYSALVDTFMAIPAATMEEHIKNILSRMVAPCFAVDLNWRGINGRHNFAGTRMAQAIVYTMNNLVSTGRYPFVCPNMLNSFIYRWFDNERGKALKRAQAAAKAAAKAAEPPTGDQL